MDIPRTDDERNMVERIILYAMNDRAVLTNVGRAVENAYKTYMREIANEAKEDYKAFKKHIIDEINKRRAPVPERGVQDYLPHGGLPLGDPRYKGDRMATDTELRSKLIRLAHTNPELREQILPLVREANNGYSQAVKEINQLIAFSDAFQALVNDRKHGGFTKSHTKLVAEFLKTLNDEILQLDQTYQLGYTPMTRR